MTPDDVWTYWLGTLDEHGDADAEHTARWWKKDPAFDAELVDRFGALHAEIDRGDREAWREAPRGLVAYVIVQDQLSRNMFRGTARMFASDARALAAAKAGIAAGLHLSLPYAAATFLLMPTMHSESLADQEACVALFTALVEAAPPHLRARRGQHVDFAEKHRVIIERFGRFPHRNALLGRASTPEELEFLSQPGSSF
jgi:uncharacterized protein (DUF924 family)